jgi:hypothetical protein
MMRGGFYMDGVSKKSFNASLGNNAISTIPLYLFGIYDVNSSGISTNPDDNIGKIHNCQIFRNGVLLRDFVSVRVGQKGYLYDRVSRQLFGNAGTGDFIIGNDVNT